MARATTLGLVLFAAFTLAMVSGQTQETASPPAATQPPDSTHVVIAKSFPVLYSDRAEKQKAHGPVTIKVLFNETGAVESSETVSGDPDLVECALAAARMWKIKPYIRSGKAVSVNVPFSFEFIFDEPPLGSKGSDLTPQPSGKTPYRIVLSRELSQKRLNNKIAPRYPQVAKDRHIEGSVTFAASVGEDGTLTDLLVVGKADQWLSQAAWEAVRQWSYKPFLYNGSPAAFDSRIDVHFTLSH